MTVENNPTLDLLRGGLYLDNNGKVAGGGYYRVEIIAQLFGVSVRRIQQLTQEGVLPTTETPEGRRYDLVPTIQSYVQYLSDKAYGKNRSEKENELREKKMNAEIALKESQGELHRLKTEIAAGKYISIEEVTLDYTRFFVTFKRFAMSLPSRITGIIGSYVEPLEARHIEKDLTGEIQKLLEAFVVAAVTEQVNGTKTKK
jgi:phage terminase Nu1 subunit (DNA packaging protein)